MMITAAAKPNWYDGPVEWVLGTPLQVIIIVVAAFIVQIVLVRVIHKIVKRTSDRARIERLEQTRK